MEAKVISLQLIKIIGEEKRLEPIAIATVLKFVKITDFPIFKWHHNGYHFCTLLILLVVVAYYIYMCTHDKNKHSILLTSEPSRCIEKRKQEEAAPAGREQPAGCAMQVSPLTGH